MIYLAGLAKTHKDGIGQAKLALESGAALEKFRDLIQNQGGDINVIENYSLLPHTKLTAKVLAKKNGYITKMDCKALVMHCVKLGGGRQKTTDKIDFAVGFIMNKNIGDKIKKGDLLLTIHHHETQIEIVKTIAEQMLSSDITIAATKSKTKNKLVIEVKTVFAPKKKTIKKKK
jgi:pyrimidine-nucleoside phosphorylase